MSHLSTTQLAELTGFSKRQIQRMAAKGEIPGAARTSGGHWQVADTPTLSEWIERFKKLPPAHELVDLMNKKDLGDAFGLVKEILERAHSLRCLLRRATWPYDSPIWGFLYDELQSLRITLETLKMPMEEAVRYVGDEHARLKRENVMLPEQR